MAVFADIDSVVEVNTVDLSDHLLSSDLAVSVDTVQTAAAGASWKTTKATFKSGVMSLEFLQDFAASSVDATLWAAFGTAVTCTYKHNSGATAATNPLYSGSFVVAEYSPAASGAGEFASFTVTWPSDGEVTRVVV